MVSEIDPSIVYKLHESMVCPKMQVCPMEAEWVEDVLPKLRNIDTALLSGGLTTKKAARRAADAGEMPEEALAKDQAAAIARKNDGAAIDAARQRYLARKAGSRK